MQLFVFTQLFVSCLLCNEIISSETSGGKPRASDEQLKWNAFVIAGLEDRLVKLKTRLDAQLPVSSLRKIYSDLTFRVGRLEGTGCSSNEMQCGGNSRQCVSEMLTCDGVKDCRNGRDEDPSFCDTSALKPGTTYEATVELSKCIGGGITSFMFRTQMRSLRRSKIFPSRLKFTESVKGLVGGHVVMKTVTTGEFKTGTRRLRSYTPGATSLWSECAIPEENFERLYCTTFFGTNPKPCVPHFVMNEVKTHS